MQVLSQILDTWREGGGEREAEREGEREAREGGREGREWELVLLLYTRTPTVISEIPIVILPAKLLRHVTP